MSGIVDNGSDRLERLVARFVLPHTGHSPPPHSQDCLRHSSCFSRDSVARILVVQGHERILCV